ncbi:TlpA disulfide reductase family protein [Chitinophaga sp. 212800008-4]|uniref:TlpA disulfide reductase family protein n=1 Tax=unclassified Chitinophaga TaxID=2619133 RepID=UPI0030D088D5
MKRALSAASGLLLYATSCLSQDSNPKTNAPSFGVGSEVSNYPGVQWIKGAPVTKFEKDKIYVVECWATWCGPCVGNIPHLNDLAKKFAGKIVVVGQDVFEDDKAEVEKFVKEQGDGMSYRVAFGGGEDGDFNKKWLEPAGVRGIPHAFVIQDNKVVWTAHPAEFSEAAFQMLVDRKFTIAAAKAVSPLGEIGQIDSLIQMAKYDEAGTRIETFIKANPHADMGFYSKMTLLQKQGKNAEAIAFAKELSVSHPKVGKPMYYDALATAKDYNTLMALTGADLEKKPDDVSTIFTRYRIFVEQNDYKSAAAMINKATTASADVKTLSTLAMLNKYLPEAKKGTEAEAAMLKAGRKALNLKPGNLQLAMTVAEMLWDNDKNGAKTVIASTADAMKKDPKQAKLAGVAGNVKESLDKGVFPDMKQVREWYKDASK